MITAMYIVGGCVFAIYIFLQIWDIHNQKKSDKDNDLGYYSRHNQPKKLDWEMTWQNLNNLLS